MRYRIKEWILLNRTEYEIQKKSIFGFWYNPDNIDAYTTGFYHTRIEAEKCIEKKLTPTITKIVKVY
jgi:hypothetical protein